MKKLSWLIWVVAMIAIFCYAMAKVRFATNTNTDTTPQANSGSGVRSQASTQGRYKEGRLSVNTVTWVGFIQIPDGCHLEAIVETKDAWLMSRTKADYDPQDVRSSHPVGWKADNSMTVHTDGHCASFKLDPRPDLVEQGMHVATAGTVLYYVHPLGEPNRW